MAANFWFCNLTTNTRNPETPQGGFAVVQAIVCALNEGNQLVFDGAEKQMNLNLNKETCFKGFSGLPATMSATVTAANNPDFASSFDYGLKMVIRGETTVVGISDKNGVKSFKMNSPKTSNGKSLLSARYGSINTSTGELFYEYTDVRLHDACPSKENGECYNRHLLVAATVPVSNGQFTGGMPTRMNTAYTNMYKQGDGTATGGTSYTAKSGATGGISVQAGSWSNTMQNWSATAGSSKCILAGANGASVSDSGCTPQASDAAKLSDFALVNKTVADIQTWFENTTVSGPPSTFAVWQ